MNINKSIKFNIFIIGIILIITFSWDFLLYKSLLDLLFISMGFMAIISAFYYVTDENTLNETITYFKAMLGVNIFQWLIFAYILYINQFQVTLSDLIVMAIAPVMTISLTSRLYKTHYLKNNQTNKTIIINDKLKLLLQDKSKVLLIFVGIILSLGFLVGFILYESFFALFGSSLGLMIIIYGLYREDKKVKVRSDYSPGMAHNYIYRDVKRVKVTPTYFFAMLLVLLLQWLIIYYLLIFVPHTKDNSNIMGIALTFTFICTMYFYIQIRESHLIRINWQGTYIGKRKIL
ncbi:MAG: hypothetical protein A4E27_01640 [Methanobacterium sp. PtaU1.Bin242]|nr:MAG: hypothetical protein A4E27_01640 [Methanobacterium sp. PtaU1.Bin242]